MKYIKYLLAFAASVLLAACSDDPEEFRLTSDIAPVLKEHAVVLISPKSKVENVTFTWAPARTMGQEAVNYVLYGQYGEKGAVTIGQTAGAALTLTKEDFNTAVINAGAPESEMLEMNFYLEAHYGSTVLTSNTIKVKIQSQGDLIEPEFSNLSEGQEFNLSAATWDEELEFSWEAARLEVGAEIEYHLYAYYAAPSTASVNDIPEEAIEIARTTETSVSMNQETFNEWIVKAGAPENQQSTISLYVVAFSKEIPEGIESPSVKIAVTTYSVNYPEKLYVAGSHQNWDPAKAPTMPMGPVKGIYECFVDLRTADGSNVDFKFTSQPGWDGLNLGAFDPVVPETDADGNLTVAPYELNTDGGAGNLQLPSGIYRLQVNYKTKTFTAVKVDRVGMIGDATPTGWDGDTEMTYDPVANTWTVTLDMISAKEYKFRLNNNWTYAIGNNGQFENGGNYAFTKDNGNYKIVLKTGVFPYEVKIISTAFAENMYLPGSHQGWDPASAPALAGDGEGNYEGFVMLKDKDGNANCEFKFNPEKGWNEKDFGGAEVVFDPATGIGSAEVGGSANLSVPSGYYYIQLNLSGQQVKLTSIEKVGLIGAFNNWEGDAEFAYHETDQTWYLDNLSLPAGGDGFKVRFNGKWDLSLGGDPNNLTTENGANMTVSEAGNYDLRLNIATIPYRLTIIKK